MSNYSVTWLSMKGSTVLLQTDLGLQCSMYLTNCCNVETVPLLEKVVYSTCSVHQRENEDVVMAVLPHAQEKGFELACPYPSWPHRGLPVFEGGKLFF